MNKPTRTRLHPDEASLYVDQGFAALCLRAGMMTDPALLKSIVEGEMYLADFDPMHNRLRDAMAQPESFDPMLQAIRSAILRRHPAIQEFLAAAIEERLLQGAARIPAVILMTCHRIFLLEILVQEMIKSPEFLLQLHRHYGAKLRELGIGKSFLAAARDVYRATEDLFETAKFLTVDNSIRQYLELRAKTALTAEDLKKRNKGLFLNIFEATVSDYARGYRDNALGGVALSMSMVQDMGIEGSNRMVVLNFKPGWAELYETWNLAFVCGKVGNADIILPKLLIPQVIAAEPRHYLFVRAITLWASAHMLMFYRLNGGGKDPKVCDEMAAIARRWGQTNLPHAEAYSQSSTGTKLNEGILPRYLRKLWNTYAPGLAQ